MSEGQSNAVKTIKWGNMIVEGFRSEERDITCANRRHPVRTVFSWQQAHVQRSWGRNQVALLKERQVSVSQGKKDCMTDEEGQRRRQGQIPQGIIS